MLGDAVTVNQTNKYNDFLPSLSFRLNVTDDVVLRFAASKTLTVRRSVLCPLAW